MTAAQRLQTLQAEADEYLWASMETPFQACRDRWYARFLALQEPIFELQHGLAAIDEEFNVPDKW
jgi:hypothetical protein